MVKPRRTLPSISEDRPWMRDPRTDSVYPEAPEDDERPTGQREAPPVDPIKFWELFGRVNKLEAVKPVDARVTDLEKTRWEQATHAAQILEAKRLEVAKGLTDATNAFTLKLEEIRNNATRRGRVEAAIVVSVFSILSVIGGYLWSKIAR